MRTRPIERWTGAAALVAAMLIAAASAEAADRAVEPGAHRHAHRAVTVRHVLCVDGRAAIKPTKYVRKCAIASALPPAVVVRPY